MNLFYIYVTSASLCFGFFFLQLSLCFKKECFNHFITWFLLHVIRLNYESKIVILKIINIKSVTRWLYFFLLKDFFHEVEKWSVGFIHLYLQISYLYCNTVNLLPISPYCNWNNYNNNCNTSDQDVNHTRNRELLWRWRRRYHTVWNNII